MGPTPRRWDEEFSSLSGSTEHLGPLDWERLVVAAYMIGEDDRSAAAWEAAHQRYLEAGHGPEAARCSFWLALGLMMRGHMAQANGWLRRMQTIVEDGAVDCTAAGYLLIPALLGELGAGNPSSARDMAVEAFSIGARLGDPDLRAFGTLGHGQALLALGQVDAGTAKLDEVMVSVTAGEVGPVASGIVYGSTWSSRWSSPPAGGNTCHLSSCRERAVLVGHLNLQPLLAVDRPRPIGGGPLAASRRRREGPSPKWPLICPGPPATRRTTRRGDDEDDRDASRRARPLQPGARTRIPTSLRPALLG